MNNRRWIYGLLLPLLLVVALLIEGILAVYFRNLFVTDHFTMAIQIMATLIFLASLYFETDLIYGVFLFAGLIYDIYFSPVLSFYTLAVLITVFLIRFFRHLKANFIRDFVVVVLGSILLNSILFIEALALAYRTPLYTDYFASKIIPTLLCNLIFFFILYIPTKKLFLWIKSK